MTSPEEIRKKALARYKDFLLYKAAFLCGVNQGDGANAADAAFFPLEIRANKGKAGDDLHKRKEELEALYAKSKNTNGRGYTLVHDEVNTRGNGTQGVIRAILFETEDDFLFFISKKTEVQNFFSALKYLCTKNIFTPSRLYGWVTHHLGDLCEKSEKDFWENIISCVLYFRKNPSCGLYIREIPLQVHTKFIEENKALILSLIPADFPVSQFESALGIKTKSALIRFRSLDKKNELKVLSTPVQELSLCTDDFSLLGSSDFFRNLKNVFVVENEMIFLTFPPLKDSLCIWGHGYAVSLLSECRWLDEKNLFYLGDIDEHGFDILSVFRKSFSSARSLCMDRRTLDAFADFRVRGERLKSDALPENLTEDEEALFALLRTEQDKGRLEQERITQDYIKARLKEIFLEEDF